MEKAKEKTAKSKGRTTVTEDILKLLLKILVIVLLFIAAFTFLFGAVRLRETAMEPNLKSGDLVIYYRLDKSYVATNVIALEYEGQTQVMRVVAVAGDTVDITDQGLVINGKLQSEPDKTQQTLPYTEGVTFPITLKEGEVFVLGDNRTESTDSRIYGAVNADDTLGEVMTVLRRRNF